MTSSRRAGEAMKPEDALETSETDGGLSTTLEAETDAPTPQEAAVVPMEAQGHIYRTPMLEQESDTMNALWNVARRVSDTEFVPSSMRGKPEKVFAAILQGRALGVDAMTSLREITVIDGRPFMSAELRMGLARRAGHLITGMAYPDRAEVHGKRGDTDEEMDLVYTLNDAVGEGLVGLDEAGRPVARSSSGKPMPWERFTSSMLWARAVSRLVDRLFPDVMIGDPL